MPKVSRKETAAPLQEVASMVVDDEQLPAKPNFSALSAQEKQAGKVEFRRVCILLLLLLLLAVCLCATSLSGTTCL
jgi:hypothetical protein